MFEALRARIRREQFAPSVFGILINPFFLARRALYREVRALGRALGGRLLDVGCGRKPYRALFAVDAYIGLEIDSPIARKISDADFFYDGSRFPFDDTSFDAVLCNQVLEHVFTPVSFLQEIARVLKPGGKLLLTVPFVWDEHEQPFDYARYSSFGLRDLLERNGFDIVDQRKTLGDFSIFGQLIGGYFYKKLWGYSVVVRLFTMAAIIMPISAIFMILGGLLPRNPDLYLDNIVLAERSAE